MKTWTAWVVAVALLAAPLAWADKKLDDAVAKAEEQLKKGRPEEALKTMEKAAAQGGAEGQIALARFHERQGKIDDAAAAFGKAVEQAAATPALKGEALAALSALDLQHAPARDAVKRAQEAVTVQESAVTLAALARAQARASLAAQATAEKAVQVGPAVAVAQEALGEAHLAAGRYNEAVIALRKAVELDPKLQRARATLALALVGQGKTTDAVAEARKATEAEPQNGELFAALGTAILADNKDKWGDAIAAAQQGKFVSPNNPVVLLTVGRLFEAQGNLDQAVQAYSEALKVDPGSVATRRAIILVEIRKGDYDKALVDAQKLATEAPDSGEAQFLLGRLLARKDLGEAAKVLEKAVVLSPNQTDAWVILGQAYHSQHKTAEAAKAYGKAVELAPNNAEYRTTYCLILGLDGKPELGVAECKKVVGTPGYKEADGYVNLGWLYRNMKRTDDALAAYRKAVELEPNNDQAMFGLARTLFNAQKFDEAITTYQKVMSIEPKLTPDAFLGIAWSYLFKKDVPQARAAYDKAQAAGRPDPNLRDRIERAEKGIQIKEQEAMLPDVPPEPVVRPDPNSIGEILAGNGPLAARCKAAQDLVRFGQLGLFAYARALQAPTKVSYSASDPTPELWSCTAAALGNMGPGAKQAVPWLTEALKATVCGKAFPTADEQKYCDRMNNAGRDIRGALAKIQK